MLQIHYKLKRPAEHDMLHFHLLFKVQLKKGYEELISIEKWKLRQSISYTSQISGISKKKASELWEIRCLVLKDCFHWGGSYLGGLTTKRSLLPTLKSEHG